MADKTLHLLKIQDEQGFFIDAQVEYFSLSFRNWTLEFTSPITEKLSFTEGDVFECLTQLRLELAKYGYKPLCAGARLDVYPSGMARDMGNGLSAQVMSSDPTTEWEDVQHIYIFDYAEPNLIASVEEQFNYFGTWLCPGSYEFKIQHHSGSIVEGLMHQNPILEPNKVKFTSSVTPDIKACAKNEFECLIIIWIELEKYGYKPLCNGARCDTYPLPDDIDVLGGVYVHILTLGKLPDPEDRDRVQTLDYAESHLITSIAEQRKNYESWLDSIKSISIAECSE
jgi:hypothetical protein